jgi:hypothetical protein
VLIIGVLRPAGRSGRGRRAPGESGRRRRKKRNARPGRPGAGGACCVALRCVALRCVASLLLRCCFRRDLGRRSWPPVRVRAHQDIIPPPSVFTSPFFFLLSYLQQSPFFPTSTSHVVLPNPSPLMMRDRAGFVRTSSTEVRC